MSQMERLTLTPASEADWLAMRAQDLTSTEIAALFQCQAGYAASEYELWHIKKGLLDRPFTENDRTKWGRRLEATIAAGIAEDHGLVIQPFKDYMRIPGLRMGSSFDYKIVGLVPGFTGQSEFRDLFEEHGPGLMEVKNVDGMAFRKGWINEDQKEAPLQIEFQVQHQMEVSSFGWTVIAPLVGGNTPVPFARLRDLATGNIIRAKVAAFWERIDNNTPPEPNFAVDADTIGKLYLENNGKVIDLSTNNRANELARLYKAAAKRESDAETEKKAYKAELLTIIGDHEKAILADGWSIGAGTTKPSKGTLITEAMLGTYVGSRAGFRNVRVNEPKAK